MKAVQDATDFRAAPFVAIDAYKMGRPGKCSADLSVGEAANAVVAFHHCLEELEVFAGEGIQRSGCAARR